MNSFVITTDTAADLPDSYIDQHELGIMSLTYTIEGETYNRSHPLDVKVFYDKMRAGAMPTTSQVNPEEAYDIFKEQLDSTDCDILHIAFSSALSGSYNSARIAAADLKEEYPYRNIYIIDSLCASLGQGLMVHQAVTCREKGMSAQETLDYLEAHKQNFIQFFTVDNLFHLSRGGRISKTSAIVGTMASIKPLLHIDENGKLATVSKIRGRKKSLQALIDAYEEHAASRNIQNDIVFISHGDCEEEALYVANLVKEKFGVKEALINHVGPTIGAHTGPGVVTLFFMGEER